MGTGNIIIGAGEFGASIARTLVDDRKKPSGQIRVLDCEQSAAASYDLYKIIRDDYANIKRMRKATEAHQQWRCDPFFAPYYHATGRVVIYYPDALYRLDEIDKTRSELHLPARQRYNLATLLNSMGESPKKDQALRFIQEAISRCGEDNLTFIYNEDDGVVAWNDYMANLRGYCMERGCIFQRGEVRRLVVNENFVETLQLSDGSTLDAKDMQVFLAAGAWTTELLAESCLRLPQPDRVPVATGVFSFHLKLNNVQRTVLAGLPAFSVYGINMNGADGGEYLPPVKGDGIAKIGWTMPFKHVSGNRSYSRPQDFARSHLACKALLQVREWVDKYIPVLRGAEVITVRSPWDGVTNSQAPLISKHPEVNNLVIASGGSYNHAKDAPRIGRSIISVIEGYGDPDYAWEVAPSLTSPNQAHLMTDNNFQDLESAAASDNAVQEVYLTTQQFL